MFSIPEQFSALTKAQLAAQLETFTSFSNKAFDSIEQVIDLNLNLVRTSLEESAATTKQLLSAQDPQEFFSLVKAQAQPNTQKAVAYGRQLADIASAAQTEFSQAAQEQIAENSRKVITLVDDVAKNAPAGTEHAFALMKSAVGNVNAGYEQFSKTAKQAAQTMEVNVAAAVNQFTQTAAKAAGGARQ